MTAVDWLIEQMQNGNFNSTHTKGRWNITYPADMGSPLEIAKAMEKQQIIQSYYAAVVDTEMIHEHKKFIYEGPEQYYNQTYKK
jgi:hypothetical protein